MPQGRNVVSSGQIEATSTQIGITGKWRSAVDKEVIISRAQDADGPVVSLDSTPYESSRNISHFCCVCGKGFRYNFNLRRHLNTHTTYFQHKCHLCGRGFHRSDFLLRHVRTVHKHLMQTWQNIVERFAWINLLYWRCYLVFLFCNPRNNHFSLIYFQL